MEKIDVAIIGGGIVGLSIAYQLLKKNQNQTLVLFEKEKYLGEHTTGRNSGVLHAGLYYETNSLKHRLCLQGNYAWESIAKELNIPFSYCGKYIVAKKSESEEFENLFTKAKLNSVSGIRRAKAEEVKTLQAKINCDQALFSPRSGILDVSTAINRLKDKIESLGGIILPFNPILNLEKTNQGYLLETVQDKVLAQKVYNCAGLFAIDLRKKLGLTDYENDWVKGHYLKTNQKNEFKTLIYPVPPKDLKGLGVHLTIDFQDQMKFGPDTLDTEKIDYSISLDIKNKMLPTIESLFKTIDLSKLYVDYAGIRPKIKKAGQLVTDFVIQEPLENYIEYLGIESPGITAALAIEKAPQVSLQ